MAKEIILSRAVKREPGYLYYVDSQGNVCKARMSRAGRKRTR